MYSFQIDKGLYPKAFCKIIPDLLAGDPGFYQLPHILGSFECIGLLLYSLMAPHAAIHIWERERAPAWTPLSAVI
jgi:hypothetical protein